MRGKSIYVGVHNKQDEPWGAATVQRGPGRFFWGVAGGGVYFVSDYVLLLPKRIGTPPAAGVVYVLLSSGWGSILPYRTYTFSAVFRLSVYRALFIGCLSF